MAPHTITHCINDDTSFLRKSRHSRDIKYRILMNIKFLCFPKCVSKLYSYHICQKKHWILSIHSSTKRYQKNV